MITSLDRVSRARCKCLGADEIRRRRADAAWTLKRRGWSLREIAAVLSCAPSTVADYCQDAFERNAAAETFVVDADYGDLSAPDSSAPPLLLE